MDSIEFPLTRGQTVETIDGRQIGTVADLGEDCFLTHRRHREDFWLPDVFVRTVTPTRVILHVDARGLRRYTPNESSVRRPVAAFGFIVMAALSTVLGFGL